MSSIYLWREVTGPTLSAALGSRGTRKAAGIPVPSGSWQAKFQLSSAGLSQKQGKNRQPASLYTRTFLRRLCLTFLSTILSLAEWQKKRSKGRKSQVFGT